MRYIRRLAVTAAAVTAMLAGLPAGGHAHAATVTHYGCTPGTNWVEGAYRLRDNIWAGPSSKYFCVSTSGLSMTLHSNAVAYGGNVVGYPSINYGPMYLWTAPGAGLPLQVSTIGKLTAHASCTGTPSAGSQYLCDADMWFQPHMLWTRHATFELVVANRWPWGSATGTLVRIHRVLYRWREWITRDPRTGYRWPLLVFRRVHRSDYANVHVAGFVNFAVKHRFLPAREWLASVNYGPELVSGGRGLTVSMYMTGYPRTLLVSSQSQP